MCAVRGEPRPATQRSSSPAGRRMVRSPLALRAVDDETGLVTGYASVFGVLDSYGDVVAQGAFARTLRERAGKIACLWQHDMTRPVGRWTTLREDRQGLYVEGQVIDPSTYRLLKGQALDGLSIGFRAVAWTTNDRTGVRTLTDVDLFEISFVTFPAADRARVLEVRTDLQLILASLRHRELSMKAAVTGQRWLAHWQQAAALLSQM